MFLVIALRDAYKIAHKGAAVILVHCEDAGEGDRPPRAVIQFIGDPGKFPAVIILIERCISAACRNQVPVPVLQRRAAVEIPL